VKVATVALTVALLVSIALNIAVRRRGSPTMPPLEYFPDMVRTARYNAFEPNPNFADGLTLRVPPPGTIPRGLLPPASENPFTSDDRAALERGEEMFKAFCVPCHGATGAGDGLVVQHGYPAPPSLLTAGTLGMNDADVFSAITDGLGIMPSYGGQMAREDRWKTILHLRKLQNSAAQAGAAP
jgi:mono/diheme cytochrome c family protein